MAGVKNAHRQRLAYRPGGDEFTHFFVRGVGAQMMIDRQRHARGAARFDHLPRVGEAQRERLVAQDMRPGGGGGYALAGVLFVCGRYVNGVQRFAREHLVDRIVGARDSEILGESRPARAIGAQHAFDAMVGLSANRPRNPFFGDDAGANQRPFFASHNAADDENASRRIRTDSDDSKFGRFVGRGR